MRARNPIIFLLIALPWWFSSPLSSQTLYDTLCWQLRQAAWEGDSVKVMEILFTTDIDIDCYVMGEQTALGYAIQEGHYGTAELLLAYDANPDGTPYHGQPPVTLAVMHNQFDIAELLILYGASPDRTDVQGLTPLLRAIWQGNLLMMDMLLHYGADPRCATADGTSPLLLATMYSDADMADRLIAHGADVNCTDNKGFTPLMIAAGNDDTLMVRRLLEAGASPYLFNSQGWNALAYAIANQAYHVIGFLAPPEPAENRKTMVNLAFIGKNKPIATTLKSVGFPQPLTPLISAHTIMQRQSWSGHDMMLGWSYGIRELRYNTRFSAGLEFRTKPAVITFPSELYDTVRFQMPGKRTQCYADVEKMVRMLQGEWGCLELTGGIRAGYSWGKYFASDTRPWKGPTLGYKAGITFERQYCFAGVSYLHQDWDEKPIPPGRVGIEIGFLIPGKKYKVTNKGMPYELR